jgi:hypothetical protein
MVGDAVLCCLYVQFVWPCSVCNENLAPPLSRAAHIITTLYGHHTDKPKQLLENEGSASTHIKLRWYKCTCYLASRETGQDHTALLLRRPSCLSLCQVRLTRERDPSREALRACWWYKDK